LPKQQVAEKRKRNKNDSINGGKGTVLVFINVFNATSMSYTVMVKVTMPV
jgi:hypothetical protein